MNKKSVCLTAFFLTVSMIFMAGCTDTSPENPSETTTSSPAETTVTTSPVNTTTPLETVTIPPTTEPFGNETYEPPAVSTENAVTTAGAVITTAPQTTTSPPPQIATTTTTATTTRPTTTTTTSRVSTTTTPRTTTTRATTTTAAPRPIEMLPVAEALAIFAEGAEADILDIDTGITYRVRRVTGGYNTIADVETMSQRDTDRLLQTNGGDWGVQRRAVIVTIGNRRIAASIAPFPHTGCECCPFGAVSDHLSGNVGTRINLDSIRGNGLIGVLDIHFFGSTVPGLGRPDAQHQAQVRRAAEFNG